MCEPATALLQLPVPWGWGFQDSYPRATLILLGDKAWLWWHPALGPPIQPPRLSFLSLMHIVLLSLASLLRALSHSLSHYVLVDHIGLRCKRHRGS